MKRVDFISNHLNNNFDTIQFNTENQKRVYKWYLIIAIIYSFIAILGSLSILIFNVSTTAQLIAGMLLSQSILGMFLFNVVMFIVFTVKKIEVLRYKCMLQI